MKIRLYGIFKDVLGKEEIEVSLEEPVETGQLLKRLAEKYKELERLSHYIENKGIKALIVANGSIVNQGFLLNNNDYVIILPPASGG